MLNFIVIKLTIRGLYRTQPTIASYENDAPPFASAGISMGWENKGCPAWKKFSCPTEAGWVWRGDDGETGRGWKGIGALGSGLMTGWAWKVVVGGGGGGRLISGLMVGRAWKVGVGGGGGRLISGVLGSCLMAGTAWKVVAGGLNGMGFRFAGSDGTLAGLAGAGLAGELAG